MLEIDMDSKCGILFVRLFGELTKNTRKKLNNETLKLLVNVGIKNVVFNLDNLDKMDEMGFKTLKKCYNVCTQNEGQAMICLNKDKFNYDFSSFNMVSDELMATRIINI